ncbi:sensor histidine kinase [Paenirhodobacter populi]|uniref:histidine kinase n=1 Tax=Paenirhodobacter populi TaxID=2306993 RepID=A0A443JGF0_9RHOB|nr:sensor histidine kinase [Sinirhodobacter populi]RWR19484.1 sensor histidine kinase [Sinirhodobacter populi]
MPLNEQTISLQILDRPTNLIAQFVLTAGVVLVVGMLLMGLWVTAEIEEGVTENAGGVTALYVDAVIAPITQDLAENGELEDGARERLEHILRQGALQDEISAFKLWDRGGRIVYSDNPALVGRVFPVHFALSEALAGRVHASVSRSSHAEDDFGEHPLMEVYSPVRSAVTGEVIAVAEFYTSADPLLDHFFRARLRSWLVVGAISLGMFSVLYVVFARGSRVIRRQRQALDVQIGQLSALLERNRTLARRLEQANRRIADVNERYLRRISAELHDGPVQLLAFAALRLDSPGPVPQEQIRQALAEAMQEIRNICGGLAMPELEGWSVATVARRLVSAHEARTGAKVDLTLAVDLPEMSLDAKICLYRFVQEILNNAAKHAPGTRVDLALRRMGDGIEVVARDEGSGFDVEAETDGLGLLGLRERVAGLKGQFDLRSRKGMGTTVTMRLPGRTEEDMP